MPKDLHQIHRTENKEEIRVGALKVADAEIVSSREEISRIMNE